jgi:molecular chaperone DnaK
MYADAQAKAQAQEQPQQPGAGAGPGKSDDGNVVDAEFTEVKDKKTG